MRRLYARNDYGRGLGLVAAGLKEAQANLQALPCALNRSVEKSARVLHAAAMYSRPLPACLEYLRRHQELPHLCGHQWRECSTRRVCSLGNRLRAKMRTTWK
jgi:hypothetical protein